MRFHGLAAIALLVGASACTGRDAAAAGNEAAPAALAPVTITSATGRHVFKVEMARTEPQQQRGLMYRTNIPADGGMLFAPYPPEGGPPREASFWMKNTPSPLDIIFIRADGTIARIAENTVPFSEAQVPSGEPVAAVLEINGGRAAELGIAEGDKVSWK
ncbi:DUF192 domain-containing protein [Sphingomonas sp. TZW2008]|uniref:DUF192 domain-containing protein n=1 Tax=Sphingomonas sp. TZW2008 TaxID=1917973 RepID=UPI000A2715C7|nr:DUF192 domain-containing protein [Sphingomonas sp. TZW2008]